MGIIRSNAAFYLEARARGVPFHRTLTLGRQRLYVTPPELAALAARYRPDLSNGGAGLAHGDHADAFLKRFLDVAELQAMDHSAYEGATVTHDLNVPVPEPLHAQYDVVIDSGTLEHVFNLPVALANCMTLVKPGGTLFLCTPANNMCGHGFYQISPELFFRVFKDVNGFALTRMVLVTHPFPGAELSTRQTWYDVRDPADVGFRAPLMTKTPAFLMVEAKRLAIAPIFATPPLQSDYVTRWAASEDAGRPRAGWRAVVRRLPAPALRYLTGWYQRGFLCTLRNHAIFRRVPK